MGWSKRQFVEAAFAELGLALYVFDLTPEQLQSAVSRLDTLVEGWNAQGIGIGYPMPGSPQYSELDTETGVPNAANEAIIANLAIRIAPQYGKAISIDTRTTAKAALNALMSVVAMPSPMQFPTTMPAGAGNKPWQWLNNPFLYPEASEAVEGPDAFIGYP
jgi:hypothetical protein